MAARPLPARFFFLLFLLLQIFVVFYSKVSRPETKLGGGGGGGGGFGNPVPSVEENEKKSISFFSSTFFSFLFVCLSFMQR